MEKRDAGDLQDMDTLQVMKTCSKWAKRVTYAHCIPEYVSMAFRHVEQRLVRPEEVKEKGQCNTEFHHMRSYEKMVSMWDGHGELVTDPE